MFGESFEQLSDGDKTTCVLGSEHWENFEDVCQLVKEFIVAIWEARKQNLYGEDSCPSQRPCQTLAGDSRPVIGVGGLRDGKLGKFGSARVLGKGKLGKFTSECACTGSDCVCSHGSAHSGGCVVNGSVATAAY